MAAGCTTTPESPATGAGSSCGRVVFMQHANATMSFRLSTDARALYTSTDAEPYAGVLHAAYAKNENVTVKWRTSSSTAAVRAVTSASPVRSCSSSPS